MSFQVLEGARTRVGEQTGAGLYATVLLLRASVMKHAQRLGRHAVDAPLRVAVVVADGDREATVIGTDQMDQLAVFTLDLQRLAFARVGRVIAGLFS